MPNGTTAAVTEAARLEEIGFPEFTAKLITDTYDALVAANLRQQGAYAALLASVTQSLMFYINSTKDDIGGDQILKLLAAAAPRAIRAPAIRRRSPPASRSTPTRPMP